MNLKQIPKVLDSKTSCLRIRVPENLDLALEGLIRKVLREQPKTDDIYSFAANYFETLLKIRDKAGAKLTASQICPFHNDEDAHEMIKIAGTFKKPQKTSEECLEIQRKKGAETQKKDVKRPPKSKQTVKDKKLIKRPTPDLIKKLPMTTKTRSEVKETKETRPSEKQKEVKPEVCEEKAEIENEEFLTSDPIKELVEKELLMQAKLNGKEKETLQGTSTELSNLESSKAETDTKSEQEQKSDDKKNELLVDDTPMKKEEKVYQEIDKKQANVVNSSEGSMKNAEETIKEETAEKEEGTPVGTAEKEEGTPVETPEKEEKTPLEIAEKEENTASGKEAEALQTFSEEIDKKEIKKDEVEVTKETDQNEKSLIEGENIVVEMPKVENQIQTLENEKEKKEEETKQKTQEEENKKTETMDETETMNETEKLPESPKQTAKGDEIPSKILIEGDTILTAEVQETKYVEASTENEINATGGQQQETEIDKETKATDENTAKIAEGTLPVGKNSFVTNPLENDIFTGINNNEKHEEKAAETEEPTGKNEEETVPTEVETKEILEEQKTSTQNISQDEGKSEVTEEVKETILDDSENKQNILINEEEHVTDMEKKDKKEEDIKEDAKLYLEEEKEKTKDEKSDETFKPDESAVKAESQISQDKKLTEEEITNQGDKPMEENRKSETSNLEQTSDALKTIEKEPEGKKFDENQAEENTENLNNKIPQMEKAQPEKTQETTEVQEEIEKNNETTTELLTENQNTSADDGKLNEEQKPSGNDNQTEEELCTVVDSQSIQKTDETENKTQEEIHPNIDQDQEDKKTETEPEELCGVVDVQNITDEKAENGILKPEEEVLQNKEDQTNPEELCMVVDVEHIPKKDATEEIKAELETIQNMAEVEPPYIVEPEKMQNSEVSLPPEEVQIKTIQTHYYDTLQVPETVTKEYIVHDLSAPSTPSITTLLSVANSLHENYKETQKTEKEKVIDENMNSPPPEGFLENITVSPPSETIDVLQSEDNLKKIQSEADAQNQQETESSIQITDSDDLLDIMTPTSGYSLNLSEISWQTINGVFLDSERRYSSLEKEEIRYTSPKSDDQNRQQVEEVIHKTVIPTGIEAVPVPPEEINEEVNIETTETEKEKKEEKGEGEPEGSSDSTNGKSADSDIPFISVEVKTVIETQMLDEEDVEEDREQRRRPGVEVKVEATIDIQDDVEMSESEPTAEENKISNGKNQEVGDLKSSLEDQKSKGREEQQKESCSTEQTTNREGSSGESDTTISSAATEIKRIDSGKRNFSSTRSLLSTQSLDLGKRNPLVKTRSLSTFRHGVTDFEVWNTIEKELEEAATKIQSKFRGYKTRKKLQRENAVQITTEESSVTTTPVELETEEAKTRDEGQQSTGEFHDSIVLAEHPR